MRPCLRLLAFCLPLALLAGCSDEDRQKPPPEAGYIVMRKTDAPLVTELTGRTSAYEQSEVRPQISGVIRRRLFVEGGMVRAGQTLYEVDPSIYRAAVAQASANLQSAEATAAAARARAQRFRPLAEMEAVSRQDYDDAAAEARKANAAVAQAQAALETARINLRYTAVPAPITGHIGRSLFTVGALVTANQAEPLAVIQRLDPIYVDIQQSSSELLALRRALAKNGAAANRATVTLTLEDGSAYERSGTVEFTETVINPATGTATLRARFPNPDGLLLPGMFVRARFAQATATGVMLAPQVAVMRNGEGEATVFVVGPDNKAIERVIRADRTIGENWVVSAGLKPGDRLIVEGVGKVKAGKPVRPVPAGSPVKPPSGN